jgi:hypothetical protein
VVRYILMQHIQGQVTVERRRVQLTSLGIRIAKGQIIALLTAHKDAFHAEKDAILEAGLATARWVTVDDTGARHAGCHQHTTHIGDDRFAWFATRPSKKEPAELPRPATRRPCRLCAERRRGGLPARAGHARAEHRRAARPRTADLCR